MENVRKHRDIRLVTEYKRTNQLLSGPKYRKPKYFSENLLAIEWKNKKVKMNKPVYLDKTILDVSKTLMYEFWYDYIKPKYRNNAKLCYKDTDSFIIHIKMKIFTDDVEKWFYTSNYSKDDKRPLPIGMNKKKIGFLKDELRGKIMKENVTLKPKTCSY